MDKYMTSMWNFVKKPQILYHIDGYYIFLFSSKEERTEVVQVGPYSYHNKPFILKPWVVDYVFDTESITTVPLWVNFPGLPVGFCSVAALRKVASSIGKPLYKDKYSVDMNRISYG
ncbi:hypothetical protein R3W88_016244 [Solanum pinnatisectum]|uniref:DUF4283 domain-containing protein n=1 Tax=Solanum pinnatisectum TaxID=50273 RepID=A0AAV9KXA3_9SOLN|nr:hypothetical protein R3W88_016244 [Solanum pinnatisectum]